MKCVGIIPTPAGGNALLPSSLINSHLPCILVVKGRLIPTCFVVQVHYFEMGECFHEVGVRDPGIKVWLVIDRTLNFEVSTTEYYQNSPSPRFLAASRSFSCGGTSSQSTESLAQAPTYSPPGPSGFLSLISWIGSPLNVSTCEIRLGLIKCHLHHRVLEIRKNGSVSIKAELVGEHKFHSVFIETSCPSAGCENMECVEEGVLSQLLHLIT